MRQDIDDIPTEKVESEKDLGVKVDDKLTYQAYHIQNQNTK